MNRLNSFLQVLAELNIPEESFEDILQTNPEIIDGNYDEFIININLLHKARVPKDEIGNLICTNANFLFLDSIVLKEKIKDIQAEGDLATILQNEPDIFDK